MNSFLEHSFYQRLEDSFQSKWKASSLFILGIFVIGFAHCKLEAQEHLKEIEREYKQLYQAVKGSVLAISDSPFDQSGGIATRASITPEVRAQSGFVVEGGYVLCEAESWIQRAKANSVMSEPEEALKELKHLYGLFDNGESYKLEVVGYDLRNLLIVMKLPDEVELPALQFGALDSSEVGAELVACGNGFDAIVLDRQVGFYTGTFSAFHRFEWDDPYGDQNDFGVPYKGNVIDFEGAVNPGDYGGPLLNLKGEVVGMLTPYWGLGRRLGTAVPAEQFKLAFNSIVEGQALPQPTLGFSVKNLSQNKRKDPGITKVKPGGAAEQAGIQVGDIIVMIDGMNVRNRREVFQALNPKYDVRTTSLEASIEESSEEPFSEEATPEDNNQPGEEPRKRLEVRSYGLPPQTRILFTLRRGEEILTLELVVGVLEEDS